MTFKIFRVLSRNYSFLGCNKDLQILEIIIFFLVSVKIHNGLCMTDESNELVNFVEKLKK